jgi:hypothetical protein
MPVALVAPFVLGSSLLAAAIGVLCGRWMPSHFRELDRPQLFGIQASTLGLLALLLGFSFEMAASRYEARRQLMVDEANAIGTSRLRAVAIPDEVGTDVRRLLQRYVDARLALDRARDKAAIEAAIAEAERLQLEVWSRAATLAKQEPQSLPAALLLQSLNEMIDLHAKRINAAKNTIPVTVLVALVVVTMIAMGWVGAGFGSTGRTGVVTVLILSSLIALVIAVIVDLDRPRAGVVRLSQASLLEEQRAFP